MAVLSLVTIAFLSGNVARDLRLLNSASSDNVQWTLSQTEVEFLELEIAIENATRAAVPNLDDLRRDFDIFYSRMTTLQQASIYAPVRAIPEFSYNLKALRGFLDGCVDKIDADDPTLQAALPTLAQEAGKVRSNVRRLSTSGLSYFATESDMRRENVYITLLQMAIGVTLLIVALILFTVYLGYLNRQNVRRRQETIQASKRMNVVTSTALDAVIVCDIDGVILDFNVAAEQMFGYSAQHAIGGQLGELIVPDHHREAHEAGLARMRQGGEKRVVGKGRIKLEAKRASGEVFPVEFAVQSADTAEGEIFVSFLRDISHRVAAEKQLVEARDRALAGEKAKTDFLATMSHEIRTPLNGLLGNLSLLQDSHPSARQSRYIKNMETSGKLLMSHISDVLDITKYDAGKLKLRPVVMNLSSLLQDIVDNQSGAVAAHNTTLTWGWSGPVVEWIYADKERIQHILMNVIGNAVKFTRDGQISVQLEVVGDPNDAPDIQITISDTGIGMDESLQAQIFDDFMTGDSSYDRNVGGTGLGLGIAQRFVKALGGSIEVASEVGKGSTFGIRFPINPVKAATRNRRKTDRRAPAIRGSILLVEDNEINRVVAREMLTAMGHTVRVAHNGKIAVALAQDQRFDLIFMDISMPVMDGRTATRAIRASGGASAGAPIIALTANVMAEERQAFISDGMNAILTKPLSRDAMSDILADHLCSTTQHPSVKLALSDAIDPQHLRELRETLSPDAVRSVLDKFCAEVDEAIDFMQRLPDHSLDQIANKAHRVAGAAATIGAAKLRAGLIAVEVAAKRSDAEAASDAAARLPGIWAETRPLLISE
ncbi:hybrid sensor histidine kinase/response regulator [Paracoccus tegillarcae]|uniref:histidine kinase n=2 Tax=Paracoccus tegillarcae TaxID=1529068 RepID=A0A2K9ETZ1_9RHOB|nr:hybrid sensor histidine kinase/response regulator [Paracoccus tegillarcae]